MIIKEFSTPMGSNVYRITDTVEHSTPSGSYPFRQYGFSINMLSLRDMYAQAKNKKSNK